jgi:hypothetical protein
LERVQLEEHILRAEPAAGAAGAGGINQSVRFTEWRTAV